MEVGDVIVVNEKTDSQDRMQKISFGQNHNSYQQNESGNVISLDSSNEETSIDITRKDINKEATQFLIVTKNNFDISKLAPNDNIIDLDAEDSDPFAPLKSIMNFSEPGKELILSKNKGGKMIDAQTLINSPSQLNAVSKINSLFGSIPHTVRRQFETKTLATNLENPKERVLSNCINDSDISKIQAKSLNDGFKNTNEHYTNGTPLGIPISESHSPMSISNLWDSNFKTTSTDARISGTTNSFFESQNIPTNNSSDTYNFEVGLVLNVGDRNQSSYAYENASLNNLALDVNININKKTEALENQHFLQKLNTFKGGPVNSSNEPIFVCCFCSLKTNNLTNINLHYCPNKPNAELFVPNEFHKMNKIFCCINCSFQTMDVELIKSHICATVDTISTNKISTNGEYNNLKQSQSADVYLSETENNPEASVKQIYNCVICSFQTTDFEAMKLHKCPLINENYSSEFSQNTIKRKGREHRSDRTLSKIPNVLSNLGRIGGENNKSTNTNLARKIFQKSYSCVSCTFQSTSLETVKSHRCQRKFETETAISTKCPLCSLAFATIYQLFQHIKTIHFQVREKTKCPFCNYFGEKVKELPHHLRMNHAMEKIRTPQSLELKEAYFDCSACAYKTKRLENVKIHSDLHIQVWKSVVPSETIEIKKNSDDPYECILCKMRTGDFYIWFTHICQEKHSEISVRGSCYYCMRPIFAEALKCDNGICDKLFHIECAHIYAQLADPTVINNTHNWFCPNCSNISWQGVQDDVQNVDRCLDFASKEYLRQEEKRSLMIKEIMKIKRENTALSEDFGRVKKFITDCKSDKINNTVVKSICAVLESFVNAGMDS